MNKRRTTKIDATASPIFLHSSSLVDKVFFFSNCVCHESENNHLVNKEPHPRMNLGSLQSHMLIKTAKKTQTAFSWNVSGPSSSYFLSTSAWIRFFSEASSTVPLLTYPPMESNGVELNIPRTKNEPEAWTTKRKHLEQGPEDEQVDDHRRRNNGHIRPERQARTRLIELFGNTFEYQARRTAEQPGQKQELGQSDSSGQSLMPINFHYVPDPPMLAANETEIKRLTRMLRRRCSGLHGRFPRESATSSSTTVECVNGRLTSFFEVNQGRKWIVGKGERGVGMRENTFSKISLLSTSTMGRIMEVTDPLLIHMDKNIVISITPSMSL